MSSIDLTTTATVPAGASLTVTVHEKLSHSGQFDPSESDNSDSQSIGDGTNTYSLSGFDATIGNAYLIVQEFTPGSAASLDSATIDTSTVKTISATVSTATTSSPAPRGVGFEISGTVTLSGTGEQGVTVQVINDTDDTLEKELTTDSSGNYSVFVPLGKVYHVTVQYDDGTNKYNAKSKPFIAS